MTRCRDTLWSERSAFSFQRSAIGLLSTVSCWVLTSLQGPNTNHRRFPYFSHNSVAARSTAQLSTTVSVAHLGRQWACLCLSSCSQVSRLIPHRDRSLPKDSRRGAGPIYRHGVSEMTRALGAVPPPSRKQLPVKNFLTRVPLVLASCFFGR